MLSDPQLRMINRNRGSGTRVLLDGLLGSNKPQGFLYEANSHQAVAAAVAQERADWGVAIRSVAEDQGLGFIPLQDEEYDFIIPESRLEKPAIQALIQLLDQKKVLEQLKQMGLIREPVKVPA
jgi:putative molybdopterin biosynthesis protein